MDIVDLVGTTNGSEVFNKTASIPVTGMLYMVRWIDGDLADGVDATLSVVDGDGNAIQTLLVLADANDDAVYYPRVLEDDNEGSDLATYTLPLVHGYLKLAVTSGGETKTGGAIAYVLSPF